MTHFQFPVQTRHTQPTGPRGKMGRGASIWPIAIAVCVGGGGGAVCAGVCGQVCRPPVHLIS